MKIDSHQHFWQYNPVEYDWIGAEMEALKRDFLPADLQPLLAQSGIDGTVAVQARQSLTETEWLLRLAEENDFIRGVVGWVDLRAPDVESQLARYAGFDKFKGVRHVIQGEPDDRFILHPEFLRGLGSLRGFNLAYDLLLVPKHLPFALEAVRKFPEQRFVVDHIAKPHIREHRIDPWQAHIRELATCKNVYCKVSGMVTEAAWNAWKPDDFRPYLDVIFDCFGTDRLMFGSDWPVCTLSGSYDQVYSLVASRLQHEPDDTRDRVFGANAATFYGL